jgi:uncharacterized protein (TIGR00297 family)
MRIIPFNFAPHMAAGAVVAAAIATAARGFGALTTGGAAAAIVVGTCAAAAGWPWAAIVIFFFVSSTALSRLGFAAKHARGGDGMAKTGARDAVQVLANGGVFTAASAAFVIAPRAAIAVAAMGAVAAATSDTWATEVGMLASAAPRSIISGRRVRAGTSGGVTVVGVLAGVAGASAIATGAQWLRVAPGLAAPVAIGGISGMIVDSILGATLQGRRHCDRCDEPTEQVAHRCGALTRQTRGLRWLDNDGVNAAATVAGAMVAAGVHAAGAAA